MEEGSFRCDANISLRPVGSEELGTRTELKNKNSFQHVLTALEYEEKRQARILDQGGEVIQETVLFDINTGRTASMRSKEEAHDYRYFPEPDLVPFEVDPAEVERIRATLPELPAERPQAFCRRIRHSDLRCRISHCYAADSRLFRRNGTLQRRSKGE